MRCAMVGDMLAKLGADNGWSGILVYGCIRDSGVIATIDIGVKAIATHPLKSVKKGAGEVDLSYVILSARPADNSLSRVMIKKGSVY